MEGVLLVLLSYLFGSIPFVYLLGRWRGIDLRREGSRNVGGGNLWQVLGPLDGALGGVADVAKGLLPVWVARVMGFDVSVAALAGIAGIVGQNWPLFLRFHGGRGISASLGVVLFLAPRELIGAAIPMAIGGGMRSIPLFLSTSHLSLRQRLMLAGPSSKSFPLGVGLGIGLLPLLALALGEPPSITLALAAICLLMVVRRLTAGLAHDLRSGADRGVILLSRLLYDRPYP